MSIEFRTEVVMPEPRFFEPLPVKTITFESRKATFRLETCEREWIDHAVRFYVGPLGMWLQADEADALGRALIECSEHFRAALANVGGA